MKNYIDSQIEMIITSLDTSTEQAQILREGLKEEFIEILGRLVYEQIQEKDIQHFLNLNDEITRCHFLATKIPNYKQYVDSAIKILEMRVLNAEKHILNM